MTHEELDRQMDVAVAKANQTEMKLGAKPYPHQPPKVILVFRNFNVAAFDELGRQIPELQKSLAELFAEHMEKCGYNPEGVLIETNDGNWRLRRMPDGGWNRDLVK